MMNKILAVLLSCIVISPAWSGSGTVNYNSTGSSPFATTTDGSSNNYSRTTIWDSAAAANGAGVNASGQLAIAGPVTNAGTFLTQSNGFTSWAGSTLGAMANYGTSPGAVLVPGVNAFITNVTNAGTFVVQATLQASSATAIGTVNPTTIGNWGLAASTQNGTTPTNGQLVMGQFNTSPTTITTGGISPFQMDNAGNLLVNIKAGAGSGGTAIADNSVFTTGTTNETPIGCYNGTPTTTAGHVGIVACTTAGSVHTTVDNANANGSATSANSSPVVIASDQAAVATKAASGSYASGAFASGSQVDLLTVIGTKAAGTAAASSLLAGAVFNTTAPTLTNGQQAAVQVTARGGLLLGNGYPAGSTPETISATGTTTATTATLATGASVTTYICGFSIRANATAAATNNATVTGTITGTLNFTQWTAPNASGLGVTEEIFNPCVPASAVNTSIAVVSGAPGASGVVSVTAWGYTL
jgi:hypothetical protein